MLTTSDLLGLDIAYKGRPFLRNGVSSEKALDIAYLGSIFVGNDSAGQITGGRIRLTGIAKSAALTLTTSPQSKIRLSLQIKGRLSFKTGLHGVVESNERITAYLAIKETLNLSGVVKAFGLATNATAKSTLSVAGDSRLITRNTGLIRLKTPTIDLFGKTLLTGITKPLSFTVSCRLSGVICLNGLADNAIFGLATTLSGKVIALSSIAGSPLGIKRITGKVISYQRLVGELIRKSQLSGRVTLNARLVNRKATSNFESIDWVIVEFKPQLVYIEDMPVIGFYE